MPTTEPIPNRKEFDKCLCGKRPFMCMDDRDMYRVSCIKNCQGCGNTTRFFVERSDAKKTWNTETRHK